MTSKMDLSNLLLAAALLLLQTPSAQAKPLALRHTASRLPTDKELAQLQVALNYTFQDPWLLRQALIHPSYGEFNNARMSWLGDAIMGAIVSDLLYVALPAAPTEELHDARKERVRKETCAAFAAEVGLDKYLVVGKPYQGEGPTERMLAEGFEALWGAIYVDAAYEVAKVRGVYAARFPIK